MSESREQSPDWLQEFQAPDRDVMSLSSASDSSPERPSHTLKDGIERGKEKAEPLSIDSGDDVQKVPAKKKKSTKTETTSVSLVDALDTQEEGLAEGDLIKAKIEGPSVSQRLPLVFPEKVQRTKALVECDGDSIDLSGDVGAVGRLVISNGPNARDDLLLDLKGTIYKSTIVPSRTFCIVSVGQTEAKIEAIMNDFIQLEPQSNLFEAETMVEGTLDGFLFDSDEEGEKVTEANPKEKNNGNEDQPTSKKTKRKNDKSPLSCCRLEACRRRRRKLQPNRVRELQEKHNLQREPRKLASELLKDTNYSLYCILAREIFLNHSATQGCLSF